jgi:hypothetical protein
VDLPRSSRVEFAFQGSRFELDGAPGREGDGSPGLEWSTADLQRAGSSIEHSNREMASPGGKRNSAFTPHSGLMQSPFRRQHSRSGSLSGTSSVRLFHIVDDVGAADHMLVHLNALTWT